jgi:branched-chain amino acid transport system substrate-binding protein
MNRKALGTVIAVVIIAIAAWFVFKPGQETSRGDITIATVGPISGQYAAFGEQMKRGLLMAAADLNASGGVMGRKIVTLVEDDACDPKQAVAAANKVAGQKVKLVAGHYCSGSSIPASAVYAEEKILQISPASTNPAFTEDAAKKGWKNIFRVCGRDDAQGKVAGEYLAKTFKDKKVAILNDKTAYGKGLAEETKKYMNAAGLTEAMYEAYTAGEKDYSALVSKMKAAGIDAFYVGGYHTEAALMIRQANEMGYHPQLLSGDAMVTDEFWKITGPAGEGAMMTFQPDPRKNPGAKDLVEKFKRDNYDPEGYTLYSYAAVQVWAQAAAKANSFETDKVAAQISGGTFDTVIGKLTFEAAKGDVKDPQYVWYRWHDGKYDEKTD